MTEETRPAPEPGELRTLIIDLADRIEEVKAVSAVIDRLSSDVFRHLALDPRLSSAVGCAFEVLETRLDILEQHYAHLRLVARGLRDTRPGVGSHEMS